MMQTSADKLDTFMSLVNETVGPEITLIIGKESIKVNESDNYALTHANIEANGNFFVEYGFDGIEEDDLGVRWERIADFVSVLEGGVEVYVDEDEIVFTDGITTMRSQLLDSESLDKPEIDIELPSVEYTVPYEELYEYLKVASNITNAIFFGFNEDNEFCIYASGENDDMVGEFEEVDKDTSVPSSMYNSDRLISILKTIDSESITLGFREHNEEPLMVKGVTDSGIEFEVNVPHKRN